MFIENLQHPSLFICHFVIYLWQAELSIIICPSIIYLVCFSPSIYELKEAERSFLSTMQTEEGVLRAGRE